MLLITVDRYIMRGYHACITCFGDYMRDRNIVIWGAGKIGRGFIGDIFHAAGYNLTFVDADRALVKALQNASSYTVYNMASEEESEVVKVGRFQAYRPDDAEVQQALAKTDLVSVSVFPDAFEETADRLAEHIERRCREEHPRSLDILLCLNAHHPAPMFRDMFLSRLSAQGQEFLLGRVGIVETLVIRMGVEADEKMKQNDPLAVLTNGYPVLTVDGTACRTALDIPGRIRKTDRMRSEETRKIYTYNMIHAVYAYAGWVKGYSHIIEAVHDPDIAVLAQGALDEISRALQAVCGFISDEMEQWNREVLKNMANPILKDTIARVGADPLRKAARNDRLIGPALLCRSAGVYPGYLAAAAACAYCYDNPEDPAAVQLQERIAEQGIRKAVEHVSALDTEAELISLILKEYSRIKERGLSGFAEEADRHRIIASAYELGFSHEKKIRGCGQCTIKALLDMTGRDDPGLFKAASGLSGGIGITGDGSCGGYIGGVLFLSSLVGRRIDRLEEGDKEAQYASFDMAQRLHDQFIETYGSITCSDIHQVIFKKSFCLREKSVRDEFEQAGAHRDKCTSVIGTAVAWTAEILLEEGLMDSSRRKENI